MTAAIPGFNPTGAYSAQQQPMHQQGGFTPGFGSPIGAEQQYGLQQQHGSAGQNLFQSPQVQQLVSQIVQIAQQTILPQVVGLAVQQIQQQVTQLVAQQLAAQQFAGQQFAGQQPYPGQQQFTWQQPGMLPFTGQSSWPWAQSAGAQNPLAGLLGQPGRVYAGLS